MELMRQRFSSGRLKTYKVSKPSSPIVRMVNIRLVLLSTLVIFIGIFLRAFQGKRIPYCDGKDLLQEECLQCPEFGICLKGRLSQCLDNRLPINGQCVENQEIPILESKLLKSVRKYLQRLRGQRECGGSVDDGKSVAEVLGQVRERYKGTRYLEEALEELRF